MSIAFFPVLVPPSPLHHPPQFEGRRTHRPCPRAFVAHCLQHSRGPGPHHKVQLRHSSTPRGRQEVLPLLYCRLLQIVVYWFIWLRRQRKLCQTACPNRLEQTYGRLSPRCQLHWKRSVVSGAISINRTHGTTPLDHSVGTHPAWNPGTDETSDHASLSFGTCVTAKDAAPSADDDRLSSDIDYVDYNTDCVEWVLLVIVHN